jgi:propionyl-CoA carboxylase alpha chain
MLIAVLSEPDYLSADTPTAYLDDHPDVLDPPGPSGDDRVALLLGAAFATEQRDRASDAVTPFAPSGWRNLRTQGQRQIWLCESDRAEGIEYHVEYEMISHYNGEESPTEGAIVRVGPWPIPDEEGVLPADDRRVITVRLLDRSADHQVIEIDGRRQVVGIALDESADGADVVVATSSPAGALGWSLVPQFVIHDAESSSGGPICPLPGTVIAVHVAAGDEVVDGQVLMVVEAMKMEHKITASSDATVDEVRFAVGDRVDTGDLLVTLDSGELADDV